MEGRHREKLVDTETDDGYLLEGALFTPEGGGRDRLPVVWIHGFTGRFYERHQVAIGRRLAARGHVFVTGNNRGHHLGANVVNARGGESLHAGAWWESFADCVHDFAAWVRFAVDLGFPKVVLAGHSLGALKAIYYMGTRGDDRVAALIPASGPMRVEQHTRERPERLALAKRMVAEGRGRDLLPFEPPALPNSAQTLVWRSQVGMDMYGVEATDPPLAHVTCPILFILGSEEPGIGTKEDFAIMQRNARSAPRTDTLYVEGADHVYTGRELAVAEGIGDWLDELERASS